jgi:hypothetical protein
VGVRDQVVYWGNSKNKYDVTVCVRAPTRYCGLLKGATVSYQVSLPAMQEFKMKSRSGAKGKGKPKAETVKKAVLQLVRTVRFFLSLSLNWSDFVEFIRSHSNSY